MSWGFTSITYLVNQAQTALIRFPLTILSGLTASFVGIYLTEFESQIDNWLPYINVMLCAALGIALFFCLAIVSEKKQHKSTVKWGLQALGIVGLVSLYFSFPDQDSTMNTNISYARYTIYNIAAHLLVSFAPFIGKGELNGFWQYNKRLFLRFCASLLYAGFIYLGLVIAMFSLHLLFNYKFDEETYLQLFILIIGLFNTWFFVAGIPKDLDGLNDISDYPKGLKIFTQYILFPLLLIYLLILYGYGAKIMINWDWPKGIVAYLIIFVAVLGIFWILMMHPFGNTTGNSWIKKFSRAYYILLLPLIALLFNAVVMRLTDYGITINRFILILLASWLTLVSLYFIAGFKNIKLIPISLSAMILFFSFGPWSMFSISERSQVKRLESILVNNGILENGKIVNEIIWKDTLPNEFQGNQLITERRLSDSAISEVNSILTYLDGYHGFNEIKPWFHQNLDSIIVKNNNGIIAKGRRYYYNKHNQRDVYLQTLGIKSFGKYADAKEIEYSFRRVDSRFVPIDGYSVVHDFSLYNYYSKENPEIEFYRGKNVEYYLEDQRNHMVVSFSEEDQVTIDINPLIAQLIGHKKPVMIDLEAEEMSIQSADSIRKYQLVLNHIKVKNDRDTLKLQTLTGHFMWKEITEK